MNSLSRLKAGKDVLRILAQYGILDTKTIRQIKGSKSSNKDIRRTLDILESHRVVQTIRVGPAGRTTNYYQLCQHPQYLNAVAELLECKADDLRQPGVYFANFPHEQACALVQKSLRDAYPDALILRDWQFHDCSEVRGLFPKGNLERKMYPDLTLKFSPSETNPKPTWIGVEVERTRKSDERLSDKIHLYAARSFFDGVVYFSPIDVLLRRIELIFKDEVRPDAYRINYYGDFFLAGGTLLNEIFDPQNLFVSCGSDTFELSRWISFLRDTPALKRGKHHPCSPGPKGRFDEIF